MQISLSRCCEVTLLLLWAAISGETGGAFFESEGGMKKENISKRFHEQLNRYFLTAMVASTSLSALAVPAALVSAQETATEIEDIDSGEISGGTENASSADTGSVPEEAAEAAESADMAGTGTAESADTAGTDAAESASVPEYDAQWVQENGHWKFQNNSGLYLTSTWLQNGGKWYYLAADGIMQTGWIRVSGKWYYMNSSGVMQTGWQKIGGKWFYLGGSGAMKTGWQKLKWSGGTSWFYFNGSGVLQTGWQKLKWSGGTDWFYFGGNGVLKTGWQRLKWSGGTNWFYFDENGAMQTVWEKVGSKWYYLSSNGAMKTGWQKLKWSGGTNWFYFSGNGAMQTGWQKIGGKWYYLDSNGAMKTGWQKIGGSWYYLKSNGAMAADEWVDGSKYYVDSSGKWVKNASSNASAPAAGTEQAYITASDTAKKTNQIILVNGHTISLWNKTNGSWEKQLEDYCGYGRNGLKLASNRKEGDATTPVGSFPILFAFGKSSNPGTEMTYRNVTSKSYWSGERSTYNTWVESSRRVSGEHLTDYYQYKYAMAIGFNTDPVVYGRGSAIFLHCKSNNTWSTGGCVSVYESTMVNLLKACRNGTYIIIVPTAADIANY